MNAEAALRAEPGTIKDHDLVPNYTAPGVRYEKRPAKLPNGALVPGLYNAWITLDNQTQFNSYTTAMAKGVILAFRMASNARDVNAFLIEMSTLPSQAPSMRTWATRLPPSSATAMFIGCPISCAFFSAAAITRRASARLTIGPPHGRPVDAGR